MNTEDVKVFLKSMNFVPVTGVLDIWRKEYISHDYAISVLFADEMSKTTINYGESIICGRKTTCNFSQPERIVIWNVSTGFWKKDIILHLSNLKKVGR